MKQFLAIIFIVIIGNTYAQKQIQYIKKDSEISIFNDSLPWYGDFIQYEPYNGKKASLPTFIIVFFTDNYLYVAAKCYYNSKIKPYTVLTPRDEFGQADYFGFYIDPYNTGLTGYGFFLTTKGVQIDIKLDNQKQDFSWDAAWKGKTIFNDTVIYYIFEIPLSSFRFSEKKHTWRINFFRNIQQLREIDTWNYIDNSKNGILNQMGYITNVENIHYPKTLILIPHFSSIVQHYSNSPKYATSLIAGMDIKYNLSKNFSLSMILIPDFGELTSDDKILNLSPYEVLYPEKRYFFTQEMEIFNKGNIFYSRRIGKTPDLYNKVQEKLSKNEVILKNPSQAQIINATKISGKTSNGIGIGFLNATTLPTYATILDTLTGKTRTILTQDLINYNISALNLPLPNNSYLSFTNTNMTSPGKRYVSNVSAIESSVKNKENSFSAFIRYSISQIYDDTLFPKIGYLTLTSLTKTSGNFRFSLSNQIISDKYNPNDLGYLQKNNVIVYSASLAYNKYTPFWKLRNWKNSITIRQSYLYYNTKYINTIIYMRSSTTTLNNTTLGCLLTISPDNTYDYFEPRVEDRFFIKPPEQNATIYISTNYAKPFAIDIAVGGYFSNLKQNAQKGGWYKIMPRYRPTDNILITYTHNFHFDYNNFGFVKKEPNSDTIVFGQRDIYTQVNTLKLNYILSNKIAIITKIRHYWTILDYYNYFVLAQNGKLMQLPYSYRYTKNKDLNFNIFNIDFILKWQFAPGSELSLSLKKYISASSTNLIYNYYDNFTQMYFYYPHLNNISLKITYYLDYKMNRNSIIKTKLF